MNAQLGLIILPLVALFAVLIWAAAAPVRSPRVQQFARRHHLVITANNEPQVIEYLKTTRQWRVAGLATALTAGLAWVTYAVITGSSGEIYVLQLFAGWFIGAVIAEARLARAPRGQLRRASLAPRAVSMYLPRFPQVLLSATLGVSLALGVVTGLLAAAGRGPDGRTAVIALVAALISAGVVWAVARLVVTRPQPVLPPDQLAADDAIRSRALHVLAGSGVALVLYAAASQLSALSPALAEGAAKVTNATALVLVFVAPLLGWWVATRPFSVRRAAPATA